MGTPSSPVQEDFQPPIVCEPRPRCKRLIAVAGIFRRKLVDVLPGKRPRCGHIAGKLFEVTQGDPQRAAIERLVSTSVDRAAGAGSRDEVGGADSQGVRELF